MRGGFRVRQHITPKHIWVCAHCGLQHTKKPAQCIKCGWLVFDHFTGLAEATRWAQLLLYLKLGKIENLERQVRFPLYAMDRYGFPTQLAVYVADFVYRRDGARVIEDVKGKRGASFVADDTAKLKLKWMEAQGTPVTIISL